MFTKLSGLALFLICGMVDSAHADSANLDLAQKAFAEAWTVDYQPTECGNNISRFLKKLQKRNVRLSEAQVITVSPQFDGLLINAERTRTGQSGATTEQNWYFHVFLLLEGKVFDFDFMNRPAVLPIARYLDQMFFDEIYPPFYPHNFVGRKEKDSYKVKVFSAAEFMVSSGARNPLKQASLGAFAAGI